MTKRERERREKSDVCTRERRAFSGGHKRRHKQREQTQNREGRKKKRCVQQLVLYLNARYNGEGKCTEEEEEEASREREREREGGRWRLEERRPALRTERRRRR